MRRIITALVATAALAVPAAASAHGSHHRHGFRFTDFHRGPALFEKVNGTGTSFGGNTATASGSIWKGSPLGAGTFTASLSTDWASATAKTDEDNDGDTVMCAPATATVTVVDSSNTANTITGSLTGKECSFTKNGTTTRAFFGRGTAAGAGSLASLTGQGEKAFLVQRADGTVSGMVLAGFGGGMMPLFASHEQSAEHSGGGCDGH